MSGIIQESLRFSTLDSSHDKSTINTRKTYNILVIIETHCMINPLSCTPGMHTSTREHYYYNSWKLLTFLSLLVFALASLAPFALVISSVSHPDKIQIFSVTRSQIWLTWLWTTVYANQGWLIKIIIKCTDQGSSKCYKSSMCLLCDHMCWQLISV